LGQELAAVLPEADEVQVVATDAPTEAEVLAAWTDTSSAPPHPLPVWTASPARGSISCSFTLHSPPTTCTSQPENPTSQGMHTIEHCSACGRLGCGKPVQDRNGRWCVALMLMLRFTHANLYVHPLPHPNQPTLLCGQEGEWVRGGRAHRERWGASRRVGAWRLRVLHLPVVSGEW